MDRENEKRVVEEICDISSRCDYSDSDDLENVLSRVSKEEYFKESVFGKRFIQRISMLSTGVTASDCVLCGEEAVNNVVCHTCMQKLSQLKRKSEEISRPRREVVREVPKRPAPINPVSNPQPPVKTNDISVEELFRDMDDSLTRLASQMTAKSIKRLSWINITISIVNLIVALFLTFFIWRFIIAP